ncbi:MAG: L,D-transpeptidase family protein [Firmicutes bacterium]|nr:L,D-transpeptidase family protein [Bacillota bacterium]
MSFLSWAPATGAQESKMIIINKKTNQLGFYQDGVLQRVFPVATGRQRSFTPEGRFRIINKIVNPYYYKKNIPGGSPYNPLGPRWLGLSAPGGPYGIHGNSNVHSIGTYASDGCIRLYNKDILWLYEQVPIGTPVMIVWNDTDLNSGFVDNKPVNVYINNEAVALESELKTFSKQSKPYIPLKLLCQLLGYNLGWNNQTNTISINQNGFIAGLTPNGKKAALNGQEIYLTDPPLVLNGTTYVTKSSIEEIFPVHVTWQPAGRELYLSFRTPPVNQDFLSSQNQDQIQTGIQ